MDENYNWVGNSISIEEYRSTAELIESAHENNETVYVDGMGIHSCFALRYMMQRNYDCKCVSTSEYKKCEGAEVCQHSGKVSTLRLGFSAEDDYMKRLFEIEGKNYVLAMSDCFLSNVAMDEIDPESIGDILKDNIQNTYVLSIAGMNVSGFYYIIRYLINKGNIPGKLILGLTPIAYSRMRAFLPEAQHADIFRRMCMNCDDEELRQYVQVVEERANAGKGRGGLAFRKAYTSASLKRDATIFAKMYYDYVWDEQSESVEYTRKLFRLAKENGVKVHVFIPPANNQKLKSYVSDSYIDNYVRNCNKIEELVREAGFEVTSFVHGFDENDFADGVIISEAVRQNARKQIAEQLIKDIVE